MKLIEKETINKKINKKEFIDELKDIVQDEYSKGWAERTDSSKSPVYCSNIDDLMYNQFKEWFDSNDEDLIQYINDEVYDIVWRLENDEIEKNRKNLLNDDDYILRL